MIKKLTLYRKLYEIDNFEYPAAIEKDFDLRCAIKSYTKYGFDYVNPYLRPGKTNSGEDYVQKSIYFMDKAIELYQELLRKHNIDTSIKTYRKIVIHKDEIDSFLEQLKTGTFIDKAYQSTSLINNYRYGYTNHYKVQMCFELTSLNCGAFIGGVSKYGNECEFLIKRDVPFEVIKVTQKGNKIKVRLRNK